MSLSIVLFTASTISVCVYRKSSEMLYKSTVESIENKIDLVNERVKFLTEGIEEMTEEMLRSGYLKRTISEKKEEEIYQYFKQLSRRYPQIVNIYFTRKDKMYLYPRNKEYENDVPGENTWYIMREKEESKSGWTDVSIDGLTGQRIITYYDEVIVDGNRIGYIDIDVSLSEILELINETKIGKKGKLYITNNKGVIAICSIKELIGKDVPDPELRKFIVENSSGTLTYNSFQEGKFITFKTLDTSVPWKVFGILPKSEVYESCYALLNYILFCAVIVATVSIGISFGVSNRIVKNIKIFNRSLIRLGEGNLAMCSEMNSKDEIAQMGSIFNDTIKKISSLMRNVKKSYGKMTSEFYEMVQGVKETMQAIDMISESIQQIANHMNEQSFVMELENISQEIRQLEIENQETDQKRQKIEQKIETIVKQIEEDTVAIQVIAVASQHQLVIVQQLQESLVLLTVYASSLEAELAQFKIEN